MAGFDGPRYCNRELFTPGTLFKLWSWGSDVFNKPLASHYQPYFEPWRSPLNKDFSHGDPVNAGQQIEWEERIFMLTNVSDEDVPGLRKRIEAKIASFGL